MTKGTNTKMTKRTNYKHYLRKTHRYLGLFIGIQFLFWTLGGLYFSWTNIKEIRGDHLKNVDERIVIRDDWVSASDIRSHLDSDEAGAITNLRLVKVSKDSFYEITVEPKDGDEKILLFNTGNGKKRENINKAEAEDIASNALKNISPVKQTEFLTKDDVGSHHEIREAPLPAWAVTFEKPANLIVYISAESGQIISFRTTKWRIFDFLWMLHTMDFYGRDNINNYALRAFSIFGIATILSGFTLFGVSSKPIRRFFSRGKPRG